MIRLLGFNGSTSIQLIPKRVAAWAAACLCLVSQGTAIAYNLPFNKYGTGPYNWNDNVNWGNPDNPINVPGVNEPAHTTGNAIIDSLGFGISDNVERNIVLTTDVTLNALLINNLQTSGTQQTIISSANGSKLIMAGPLGQPVPDPNGQTRFSSTKIPLDTGTYTPTDNGSDNGGLSDNHANDIQVPIQIGRNDAGIDASYGARMILSTGYRPNSNQGLLLSGGLIGSTVSKLIINGTSYEANSGTDVGENGKLAGNLTVGNSPTYQGIVGIVAGGLRVTGNSLTGSTGVTVASGGQLQIDGAPATFSLNGVLSITGPGKQTSAAALTANGYGANFQGALRYNSVSGTTNFTSPIDLGGKSSIPATGGTADGGMVFASNQGAGAAIFVNAGGGTVGTLNVSGQVTGANSSGGSGVNHNRTLTKVGGGTLILGNNTLGNVYEGGTWVKEGSLVVNNPANVGSATGRRFVTVDAGATLSGVGMIITNSTLANAIEPSNTTGNTMAPDGVKAVRINGALSPGVSDGNNGTLDVGKIALQTDKLTFGNNASLKLEVASAASFDVLDVTIAGGAQPVTIGSGVALYFTISPTFSGGAVNTFLPLINNLSSNGFSGAFSNIAEGATATAGGYSFVWTYAGGTGNDFGLKITSTGSTPLLGDYDSNGVVNGADFLLWQRQFGQSASPAGSGADGSANGVVDAADLTVWKTHFGQTAAVPTLGAVPEPSSLALGALAVSAGAVLRRRSIAKATS
ncbi:hypothetical protein [Lacipirellula sp.]|uniref:hypothetical protein n=1 Tax=Lacipirellula sp. TaxID=2691419 RepID=UPI003D0B69E9